MVKIKREDLTQEIVRELIDYCPETGDCVWKSRGVEWFEDGFHTAESNMKTWNTRYANKKVGYFEASSGYINVRLLGFPYRLHRVIWLWMTGEWPEQVDHENGIRDDNRWPNLRNVTNEENGRNTQINSRNTSGVMGVRWHPLARKWQARIHYKGTEIYLGLFVNFEDAVEARRKAEIEYGFHQNHGRKKTNEN